MKRDGFVLILVVVLLGFVGIIALYSMERMRLAVLIEENRVSNIREQAELESSLDYVLQAGNAEEIIELIKQHVGSDSAFKDKEYDTVLRFPDGTQRPAQVNINTPDQTIHWKFRMEASGPEYTARQNFSTLFDRSAQAGGMPLGGKIDWLTEALTMFDSTVLTTDKDLIIRLSTDTNYWEVYELETQTTESVTEEPATEPEVTEEATESTEEVTTEEPGETEEENSGTTSTETENPVTDPVTELPITELPATEVPSEAVTEKLILSIRVSAKTPIRIITTGNITISGSGRSGETELYGVLIADGDLRLRKMVFNGIVLQRGRMESELKASIKGYYESDHVENIQSITYHPGQVSYMRAGMHLPDFFSIHTKGIRPPAPDNFDDP